MQNGGVQVGSVPRTMSTAVMLGNAPLGGQYQDSLESLDQATWQGLASHARGFDLTSPEVQEQIDVTDARLKSIFDAFDQDWDGTLTRNELLQGLAQQGFPGLDGTSAFEALWEACDKSGGKAKGVVEQDQHHREYCITFDAFKRIVQRLKTEVLFLPDLHPGCSGLFAGLDVGMTSRASTPVPGLLGPPPSSLLRPHLPPHGASSLNYYPQPPPSSSSSAPYKPSTLSGSSGLPPRYGSTMVMAGPVAAAAGSTSTSPYQQQAMMGGAAEESKWPFEGARFSYVDYNEKKYRAEIPVQDPYSFFTAHRDSSDFIMRWLHLEGADRLNILRLGVKYSVHPLAVEDSLKLDEQQPKVNAYGSHYFIVVPFFRLARESREGMEALRQQRRHHGSSGTLRGGSIDGGKVGDAIPSVRAALLPRDPSLTERAGKDAIMGGDGGDGGRAPLDVQVEWSKLCLFVAGPPLFDTVISIHTKWEPFNAPPREDVPYSSGGGPGEAGGQPMLAPHRHVFESIVNQLKVDYSTLRQGNSKQLLYRILDEVVDNIQPITRAYRMRVRHFQDQLQQPDFNFTKEEIKDLINMKSELQRLQRRMRPITSVIRHLMEDNNVGKDIKVYLDDVAEHVVRGLEEISGCIEMVDSTKEESRSLREQRGNEVLYTLTIITSIFVPLQFLTGIYGMNFVDRTGHPSMPELTWQYGYAYFWLLAGAILVCLISYFRFVKRWL